MDEPREMEQRGRLARVLKVANISVGQLWLRYFGSGGTVAEYEIDAYVQGLISLPTLQRDILALSANELVDELPALPRAPMDEDIELRRGHETHSGGSCSHDGSRNRDDGTGHRGEDRRKDYSGFGPESDPDDGEEDHTWQ